MKSWLSLLPIMGLFLAGCGEKPQVAAPSPSTNASTPGAPATMFTNNSSGSPITAPVDYLGSLGRGKESAIKTVDVAQLTQAIQMFNVDEGRFPTNLNELVEKQLIPKIPDAPYGLKLDYDPTTGEVRVVHQ
jgi:hypothetical protein